jgi:hypothetical protein
MMKWRKFYKIFFRPYAAESLIIAASTDKEFRGGERIRFGFSLGVPVFWPLFTSFDES